MAASLKDKVQNSLDETRMLILGSQVLLGFGFRAIFEPGFEKLPEFAHTALLVGLILMLIALGLLLTPGAYHRIVSKGEDTEDVERFTTELTDVALLPVALGLGLVTFITAQRAVNLALSVTFGAMTSGIAFFFWYGLEFYQRKKRAGIIMREKRMKNDDGENKEQRTELKDKIKHVLTETRVVLPGAQALLGFQFVTTLSDAFEKMPNVLKYIHLASLGLVAVATVFLMTPAAYHRLVEEGELTEHFHRFASAMVIAALIPLALGICGDFYVVLRKVTNSEVTSIIAAGLMLLFFYGMWFGLTLYLRGKGGYPRTAVGRLAPQ